MMLKGLNPYPVTLDMTSTIEAVRAKYDGTPEAGQETDDVVGVAGRVLFIRNAGGLCFVQLAARRRHNDPSDALEEADRQRFLKLFKAAHVDLGDHLFRQRPCDRLEDRRAVDLRRRMGHRS